MKIIGLSGFARSGKDEAARVLVEEFGFKQIAFADKLREVLYALNPIVTANAEHHGMVPVGYMGMAYKMLQDVIDEYGWLGYKEGPFGDDIRRLLQRLGTEAGRQTLWDSIWIDAALIGHPENAKIVVSDARFFNEFDAIRERGGAIWRIERKGVGPLNMHASEMEAVDYPHFDCIIENDGGLKITEKRLGDNIVRVGFDSDGCLDDFHTGVRNTLEAKSLGHLWKSGPNPKSYWNYFEDWGWSFEQFKELCDYGVDNGLIFTGHFFDTAAPTVQRVKDLGHEVIIITDRSFGSDPINSQNNTIDAYRAAGIDYDEIHFTADKTSIPVDIMCEDKLQNYDDLVLSGTPTWLINREWNEVPGGDARNRINDVSEYADAIEHITLVDRFVDLAFV